MKNAKGARIVRADLTCEEGIDRPYFVTTTDERGKRTAKRHAHIIPAIEAWMRLINEIAVPTPPAPRRARKAAAHGA